MAFIPPVLALPPEITAEIFSHYVGTSTHIPPRSGGPLVLAEVCTRWREICLSTCSLWASVSIDDRCNWNHQVNLLLLQRWMARAGNHLLDLNIWMRSSSPFPILSQYSSRWRSLRFRLNASVPFPFPNGTRVLALVRLDITIPNPHVAVTVTAFREAPSLREVLLSSLGPSQSILLPFVQLTFLRLWRISLQQCLDMLKETPKLEVLSVDTATSRHSSLQFVSPTLSMVFPHLHTLSFCTGSSTVLDHFTLPALETLKLTSFKGDGVARLLELAVRSSCSPRSIAVWFMEYEMSYRCFRAFPSLEKVEIFAYPCSPEPCDGCTLASLVNLLNKDDFLPALCEMKISHCPTEISSSVLAEMLVSRWHGHREGVARLKSFHLSFSFSAGIGSSAIDELRGRVRPLKEAGMDLVIERTPY
ncbi:F-box domain-containing protein [Mycena venus]|uniref:F-box domain-containing protein n=1 Tax=Mycena venus TaxID=2733690 RepID=A0A8H6Y2B1_9AGAR|nr:F-box domain-containing protein [Mycena venus]